MPLRLTLRTPVDVPVELQGVLPESLVGRSLSEVEQLPILLGNREVPLASLFEVTGNPADDLLDIRGSDLKNVHGIGSRMTSGAIRIAGNVGRHIGAQMSGGTILVQGSAGDWLGAEMRGGLIRVRDHVGHCAGAAYRGSPRGMTGGTILVAGNAGNEAGRAMRRGTIAIGGNSGDATGFGLLAGTIVVGKTLGIRAGANMRRGTIVQMGAERPKLLPTFRPACRIQPNFWRLLILHLKQLGLPVAKSTAELAFDLYRGDFLAGGRGEILLAISGDAA